MCRQCERNPVYEFTNQRKLCRNCFIKYFQKKFLYTIRKFRMIKDGDIIGYFKSTHFRVVVLEDILKLISKERNIKLVKLSIKKRGEYLSSIARRYKVDKLAWATTSDMASEFIISNIIKWDSETLAEDTGPVEFLTKNAKIINPLYLFLDEEILLYARIKKLKFKLIKEKKDKISSFIDELEEKHPEIKRAIVNGLLKNLK